MRRGCWPIKLTALPRASDFWRQSPRGWWHRDAPSRAIRAFLFNVRVIATIAIEARSYRMMSLDGLLRSSAYGFIAAFVVAVQSTSAAVGANGTAVHPGSGTEAINQMLALIEKEYRAAEAPLRDVLVRGRVSRVVKQWAPGMKDQLPSDLPAPQWAAFTLVHRHGNRRYELDFVQPTSEGQVAGRLYKLMDGSGIYSFSGSSLAISPIRELEDSWLRAARAVFAVQAPRDANTWTDVGSLARNYIARISGELDRDGARSYFARFNRELRCSTENGLVVIEDVGAKPPWRITTYLDPANGYHLARQSFVDGGPGDGLYYREARSAEYREPAPGLFFLSKGTAFSSSLGKGPEGDGGAGWVKQDVEIDDVLFGDFEYDDAKFDASSLPIPIGAQVIDYRTIPPSEFVFGREPLDEQLLRESLAKKPATEATGYTWLFLLNGGAVAAVILAMLIWKSGFSRRYASDRP